MLLCIVIYASFSFFRLARGSILASVIRIIPGGSLRVMALYVSGLFVVFYVVIIAQFVWVCEMNIEPNSSGCVPVDSTLYLPHLVMNGPNAVSHGA